MIRVEVNMSISRDELEQSYRISAELIKFYGQAYLPIFKRLHDEVARRKADDLLVGIAHEVADGNNPLSEQV